MNITMKQVEGGVCAAAGFSANGLNCGLNPDRNKNDLALIWSETVSYTHLTLPTILRV